MFEVKNIFMKCCFCYQNVPDINHGKYRDYRCQKCMIAGLNLVPTFFKFLCWTHPQNDRVYYRIILRKEIDEHSFAEIKYVRKTPDVNVWKADEYSKYIVSIHNNNTNYNNIKVVSIPVDKPSVEEAFSFLNKINQLKTFY